MTTPPPEPSQDAATSVHGETKSPESMNFSELDFTITERAQNLDRDQKEFVPYLEEMRLRLSKQGRRSDLPDTPKDLTWQAWVKSKRQWLGSLSTVQRLLRVPKPKKGTKPKHLTQLEFQLLGSAAAAHDAITDLRANRIEEAIAKLASNLPTKDRITEHLERGIEPTILNPEGTAEVHIVSPGSYQEWVSGADPAFHDRLLNFLTKTASSLRDAELRAEAKALLQGFLSGANDAMSPPVIFAAVPELSAGGHIA